MNIRTKVANAATRTLSSMFPGYYPNAKHDHNKDFGYPDQLDFNNFYRIYKRNGIARSAVEKTVLKTWQDFPDIWESETPKESPLEADIRQRLSDLRFWQHFSEADRRSIIGGYSALILRLGDSLMFHEPAERVPGGLQGLVEVIPAWAGQLEVSEWDSDPISASYGHPKMYSFNEAHIPDSSSSTNQRNRVFQVHPSRVVILSRDGTVHCSSILEAGYNDLIDMEKIKGAGGEGFWKNAKSAPVLNIDKEARLKEMALAMGVPIDEVYDEMNAQVEKWQKGFDQILMLQGMQATTLGVTLPQPAEFFNVCLQSFASSFNIPLKILVGSQTGERASTEDANEWAMTNKSRRINSIMPTIFEFLRRLEAFGILPVKDWTVDWPDLTESSMEQKFLQADKMASVNQKMGDEPAFLVDEIREVVGMNPIVIPEGYGESDTEEEEVVPPKVKDDPLAKDEE